MLKWAVSDLWPHNSSSIMPSPFYSTVHYSKEGDVSVYCEYFCLYFSTDCNVIKYGAGDVISVIDDAGVDSRATFGGAVDTSFVATFSGAGSNIYDRNRAMDFYSKNIPVDAFLYSGERAKHTDVCLKALNAMFGQLNDSSASSDEFYRFYLLNALSMLCALVSSNIVVEAMVNGGKPGNSAIAVSLFSNTSDMQKGCVHPAEVVRGFSLVSNYGWLKVAFVDEGHEGVSMEWSGWASGRDFGSGRAVVKSSDDCVGTLDELLMLVSADVN